MKRIHELSRLSQFLLFFVAPLGLAVGTFPSVLFNPPPTVAQEVIVFILLYFVSLAIVGFCFYFVQGTKWFTAYLVEKQRLARKRNA